MITLPLFITESNRIRMAFFCGLAFLFGYSIPNHFHYFIPQQLPLTEYDRAVPFLPWTIFVYTSEYVFFATAYFMLSDEVNRNRYIWSYFGVLLVGSIFFFFYPTTYPRGDYPLPTDIHPLTFAVFNWLRSVDDPSNCFPSMHVTCCFITAFSFLPETERRWKFWLYFIWAIAIAASTLPTKQHYLADVIGGGILSVVGYWVFFKKVKYIPVAEYSQRVRHVSRQLIESWRTE